MNLFEQITDNNLNEYGKQSVSFIDDTDNFLNLFFAEYNVIMENISTGNVSMITNPELFADLSAFNNVENIADLKEKITECLYKGLYFKKYISESEYDKLCNKGM